VEVVPYSITQVQLTLAIQQENIPKLAFLCRSALELQVRSRVWLNCSMIAAARRICTARQNILAHYEDVKPSDQPRSTPKKRAAWTKLLGQLNRLKEAPEAVTTLQVP
jgi:hypothetical protein